MKPISVNVDFEETLLGRPVRLSLRASVEFLSLWVQARPLLASRNYPSSYLTYVQERSGQPVSVASQGVPEEWWGDTSQKELMRQLSSKTEFRTWWESRWPLEARNCFNWDELCATIQDGVWLIKKSDGMSGRGHSKVTVAELPQLRERLEKSLGNGVVVEPLYQRTRDLSALWLDDEQQFVYYANMIDERFQWRGSIMRRDCLHEAPEQTGEWSRHLGDLQKHVESLGYLGPFSVDAFFYQVGASEKFHPGSEMNPRKTMGWVSYQLWKKNKSPIVSLALIPRVLSPEEWGRVSQLPEAMLLSPPESPFTWYWLEAENEEELESRREAFVTELPEAPNRGKV